MGKGRKNKTRISISRTLHLDVTGYLKIYLIFFTSKRWCSRVNVSRLHQLKLEETRVIFFPYLLIKNASQYVLQRICEVCAIWETNNLNWPCEAIKRQNHYEEGQNLEIAETTSGNFPVFLSAFRLYISTEPFSI